MNARRCNLYMGKTERHVLSAPLLCIFFSVSHLIRVISFLRQKKIYLYKGKRSILSIEREYVSVVPFIFNNISKKKKRKLENERKSRKKLGNVLKFTIDRIFIHTPQYALLHFISSCRENIFKNKIGFGDNFQMFRIKYYHSGGAPIMWISRKIDKWIVFSLPQIHPVRVFWVTTWQFVTQHCDDDDDACVCIPNDKCLMVSYVCTCIK